MAGWTADDIPDLTGRIAVVTGANSGIGRVAATELARHGARVFMACRSEDKARAARDEMLEGGLRGSLEILRLDLADLDSVAAFSDALHEALGDAPLDLLVNNAGVMALPHRTTKQGFEMQLGTNHLGHFALTGRLLDVLVAAPSARIVNLTSGMHRMGRIQFDDLMFEKFYQRWLAYGQSKLANIMFSHEAARRLAATHPNVISVACHPGLADTHLQQQGAEMEGSQLKSFGMSLLNITAAQSAESGALPTLFAATSPEVENGDFIGPAVLGMWGSPRKERSSRRSRDEAAAKQLWEVSMDLTGVRWLE